MTADWKDWRLARKGKFGIGQGLMVRKWRCKGPGGWWYWLVNFGEISMSLSTFHCLGPSFHFPCNGCTFAKLSSLSPSSSLLEDSVSLSHSLVCFLECVESLSVIMQLCLAFCEPEWYFTPLTQVQNFSGTWYDAASLVIDTLMPNSIFTEYTTTVARIQTSMGRSWAFSLSGTMSLKAGFLGLGSLCSTHLSHHPFIVMIGWIIDCRTSLKGSNGIMWASFFAHCMAATASVCDCSICSRQDDIVCHTSSVNVPGGNSWKMSSSSTFRMLPGKSSSELSVDNLLGHRNLLRGSQTVFSTVFVISVTSRVFNSLTWAWMRSLTSFSKSMYFSCEWSFNFITLRNVLATVWRALWCICDSTVNVLFTAMSLAD